METTLALDLEVPYPVDLSLLENQGHTPSVLALQKSMKRPGLELADYCIPVNPYFPPASLLEDTKIGLGRILKFYPSSNESVSRSLSVLAGVDARNIVMGNGSTELIHWMIELFLKPGEALATSVPTFGRWTDQPLLTGRGVHPFFRLPETHFRLDPDALISHVRRTRAQAVVICNPNNPTGALLGVDELTYLMDAFADLKLFVVDESFIDFSTHKPPTVIKQAVSRRNVVVLKSLGKNFGLHGIRFGFAAANEELATRLRDALPHWNINGVAEYIISRLPEFQDEYEKSRIQVIEDRLFFENLLGTIPGLEITPSQANFTYVRLPDAWDGVSFRNELLLQHGLLIRECGSKIGSDSQYFRIATRPRIEAVRLVEAMKRVSETD